MADIQWFFAKSKVPICLAITDSLHFLNQLKNASILTEEEALELQGDTRTVQRVVYESLCWIEDKNINSEDFFTFLFEKSLLKRYPDLKPIHAEYIERKFRHGIYSTTDEDKDSLIFAQDKVHICLTITDRFPFLHGLQDLTILSESESLKLQADERPVSRVIYESLSLIEKKDMKLNIVFEYIFQQCYLKLYPGLQNILQEPSEESVGPFNGGQYPMFNIATDLLEFFEHNKTYICEAVNDLFPFLHGLHDSGLLSHMQLLTLQADKKTTNEVLYDALCHIKTISDIENFFAYLFQKFYLKLYPELHVILQCLNAALTLDICPTITASCTEKIDETGDSNIHIAVMVKEEIIELPEQNADTPSTVSYEDKTSDALEKNIKEPLPGSDDPLPSLVRQYRTQLTSFSESSDLNCNGKNTGKNFDILPMMVRKCRMQPVSYSEPPDLDWGFFNGRKGKAPENVKRHKYGKIKSRDISQRIIDIHRKNSCGLKRPELVQVTKPVTVKLEFPKQVFNEQFKVRCGNKTGIFKKRRWNGHSSKDLCIHSEGKRFSVISFERYGGKKANKSWKKSILCEEIKLDSLIKAGILKSSTWYKR
ncbi:hypothetical protein PRIEUP_LOCUS16532, partial [Pristimantis euphronides]